MYFAYIFLNLFVCTLVNSTLDEIEVNGKKVIARNFTSFNGENDKFFLESKSRTGLQKSNFQVKFSLNGFPHLRVKYKRKNASANDLFASYRVGILALAEFNSTLPVSSRASVCRLSPASSWSNLQYSTDEQELYTFKKATTSFTGSGNCTGLTVNLDLLMASNRTEYQNQVINPNGVKYSIQILNFPYKLENSQLALVQGVFSKGNGTLSGNSISFTEGNFNWTSSIKVDSVDGQVTASQLQEDVNNEAQSSQDDGAESGENRKLLIFEFSGARPANITWDPEVGVNDVALDAGTTSGSASSTKMSFWIVLVSVFVTIFISI